MSNAPNSTDLMDTDKGFPVSRSSASENARSMDSMEWFLRADGIGCPGQWLASDDQMRGLMKVLICIYGQKFKDQWNGVTPRDLRAMWGAALARYTPEEVQRGLKACMSRIWPPTLPEFLLLCRPPVDHEAAFIEAVKQMRQRDNGTDTWSAPAIYWAAVEFGSWELRQASWDRAKARWTRILDEQLAKGELPPVPPRMDALPAPGKATANPEKVRELIDGLRQRMAMPKGAA